MKILLLLKRIFNICLRGAIRTGSGGSGGSCESDGSGGSGESGGSGGSGESGGKISENLGKSQKISEVQVTNLCSSGGMNNSKCS